MSTDTPLTRSALVLVAIAVALTASCAPDDAGSTPGPSDAATATSVDRPTTTSSTSALPGPERVDDVIGRCPTLFDVDYVRGRVDLVFDADPTAPILVCEESDGSADLTRLQERAIQVLLMMEATTFEEPLPWTDLQLFDWFTGAVDGIRFRDDIDMSFCCDPDGYIDVQTSNLAALDTTRWVDPSSGTGLLGLVALFVHEARHNEGKPHTCEDGTNDVTTGELGAWAVEAFLFRWYADHSDQRFFEDPDRPGFYARTAEANAERILETRFCGEDG